MACEGSSDRLQVGDKVQLAPGVAVGGPLKPSDVGKVLKVDVVLSSKHHKSNTSSFKVEAVGGETWWCALKSVWKKRYCESTAGVAHGTLLIQS